ncbi:hypothetical protein BKA65DRAFT_57005 [Rhexocercosporidium sp. MPI-PUGE-AT-0058]|nr:hypothetical protein BKA65DRAFT_57005 [Rhexocercosporidium sp. MPI-PUGE-AT-0058]
MVCIFLSKSVSATRLSFSLLLLSQTALVLCSTLEGQADEHPIPGNFDLSSYSIGIRSAQEGRAGDGSDMLLGSGSLLGPLFLYILKGLNQS